MKKVLTVVGARPQFIKAAAVSRVLHMTEGINEVMVHTGQHFDADMSDVFFEELAIPQPRHKLNISGGNHGQMTGRMLIDIEGVIEHELPDCMLVYGDTNSTLAGALAAAKMHVPVVHVEAGLRSFNRKMPEEVNRVLTDHLSALLFCPTHAAVKHLEAEGIEEGVFHTGDVMYDATIFATEQAQSLSTVRADMNLEPGAYAVATIHRAENTDDPEQFRQVIEWLKDQAKDQIVVFPLHPRSRHAAARYGVDLKGLNVCAPVGYIDMAQLLQGASAVFTDSGGLQKEAYFHKTPCVTLRTETEWVETIEHGWNRLWTQAEYKERKLIAEYGNGNASDIIADLILRQI